MAPPTSPTRPNNTPILLLYTLTTLLGLYFLRILPVQQEVPKDMTLITSTHTFNGVPIKQTYTGHTGLDTFLAMLVVAFISGTAGWEPALRLQQIHFLFSFFSILVVWNVEACRVRNRWRVVSLTGLFALGYQTIGGAVFVPLYYVFYFLSSSRDTYHLSGRRVPLSYATTLLPACVLGYLIPTLITYYPWQDIAFKQTLTAAWQPIPMLVNVLLLVFSTVAAVAGADGEGDVAPLSKGGRNGAVAAAVPRDVQPLKRIYIFTAAVGLLTHIYVLLSIFLRPSPTVSLSSIFIPNSSNWKDSTALGLHWIFIVDEWMCFVPTLVWLWIGLADVKRLLSGGAEGKGKGQGEGGSGLVGVVLASVVGMVVLGPGTVVAVLAWWREEGLVSVEERLGGEGRGEGKKRI